MLVIRSACQKSKLREDPDQTAKILVRTAKMEDHEQSDQGLHCLFDLIFYVPSTIFQLNRDGSSWVEPVLS